MKLKSVLKNLTMKFKYSSIIFISLYILLFTLKVNGQDKRFTND